MARVPRFPKKATHGEVMGFARELRNVPVRAIRGRTSVLERRLGRVIRSPTVFHALRHEFFLLRRELGLRKRRLGGGG